MGSLEFLELSSELSLVGRDFSLTRGAPNATGSAGATVAPRWSATRPGNHLGSKVGSGRKTASTSTSGYDSN